MPDRRVRLAVRDAAAFDDVVYLGLARRSKRDPYRLGLFAQHLEPEERPLVLLAIRAGTLVVTDRRILEFRAHLEVHGAWNVKEFQGYEVRRTWDRAATAGIDHEVATLPDGSGTVEDSLRIVSPERSETVTVSRGPEPTLPDEDFAVLKAAVLGQAK